MNNKKEAINTTSSENVKGLFEIIASKISVDKGKGMLTNLGENIKDNIQEKSKQAMDFIQSLKKDKIRSLENLLDITKKDLKRADKNTSFYTTEIGRVVIIDKDIWGEPCTATIKEGSKVVIKVVKFFKGRPFLYPMFDEKPLKGEIIFMDENEIWYRDVDEATLVLFKNNEPDFLNVKLKDKMNFSNTQIIKHLHNCKMLHLEKRLNNLLLVERQVKIEDIITIRRGHLIYKNKDNEFSILIFDALKNLRDEFSLKRLPILSEEAMDVLFTEDIVTYVRTKEYSFANFRESDGYIEYWENVGSKRICVMRCRF